MQEVKNFPGGKTPGPPAAASNAAGEGAYNAGEGRGKRRGEGEGEGEGGGKGEGRVDRNNISLFPALIQHNNLFR